MSIDPFLENSVLDSERRYYWYVMQIKPVTASRANYYRGTTTC